MITYSKYSSLHTDPQTETRSAPLRNYVLEKRTYFSIKRVLDVLISLLVTILVLSWLFPVVALIIKLTSKGPAFFIQRRVGRGGRSFPCLKFRTMVVNDQANTCQADENDDRITRVGRFLRQSNLDEFPQFLNVFLGHMSLVGPRPHMYADCNLFSSAIPGYKFRNIVKPGITGLAQVKGYRGATSDFKSMFHRYQFDAFYVRNANFWLDMRIIRKTIVQTTGRLFSKEGKIGKKSPRLSFYRKWAAALIAFFI